MVGFTLPQFTLMSNYALAETLITQSGWEIISKNNNSSQGDDEITCQGHIPHWPGPRAPAESALCPWEGTGRQPGHCCRENGAETEGPGVSLK